MEPSPPLGKIDFIDDSKNIQHANIGERQHTHVKEGQFTGLFQGLSHFCGRVCLAPQPLVSFYLKHCKNIYIYTYAPFLLFAERRVN